MVELPAPGAAMVAGVKLTVVPAGTPAADKVMALLKPLETVVEITERSLRRLAQSSKLPGEIDTAKFGSRTASGQLHGPGILGSIIHHGEGVK